MKKLLIITIVFQVFIFCDVYAQTGREFWFVAPDVTAGHWNQPPCEGGNPRYLNISAMSLATEVKVSQPANPGFTPVIFNLNANETFRVDLSQPGCNSQTAGYNTIENIPENTVNNYGILIESDQLITAYYEVGTYKNPDIWALKADNALGKEFYVPMQNKGRNHWGYDPDPYNEVHIVATEDNTTITIDPSVDAIGRPADTPFQIVLNRGQTYNLRARNSDGSTHLDGDEHLNGTYITSDKPIAVTISDDSVAKDGCRDIIGDQLVPTDIIGEKYIVMPGQLNDPEYVYILGTQDNTSLTIGGVPSGTIDAEETYAHPMANVNTYIEADKPIYVLHVGGFGCEMGGALIPPIFCTGSPEVYATRSTSRDFFMNLMVPSGGEDSFFIELEDGSVFNIPTSWFSLVSGTSNPQWMALKPSVNNPDKEFNYIPANEVFKVYNTKKNFHMGIINGGTNNGCNYGYFSDFGSIEAKAEVAVNAGDFINACYGDSVQLIATGGLEYYWNRVSGGGIDYLNQNRIPNPIATPLSGFHDYDVNIKGDCNLDTTLRITIQMSDILDAKFHVEDPIICAPDSIHIINESVGVDTTTDQVIWYYGDGTSDNQFAPDIYHYYENTSQDSTIFEIYLFIKDFFDCIDTLRRNVMIYPEIHADFDVSSIQNCHPHTVTFTNTSYGDTDQWDWEFGDLTSSTDSAPAPHQYTNFTNNIVQYQAELIATSQHLCRDTADTVIYVYPYIKAGFTTNKTSMCAPDTLTIINNSIGGITETYWDFGDGTHTLLSDTSLNPDTILVLYENTTILPRTDTITQTIQNIGGCTDVKRRVLTVYPEIIADFSLSGDTVGCSPYSLTFNDNSNSASQFYDNYNWDFGDGGTSNQQSASHTFENNGTGAGINDSIYTVMLFTEGVGGCTDSDTAWIRVHPFLDAGFTTEDAFGCAPFEVAIYNESLGDNEVNEWTYDYLGNVAVVNQDTHTFTYDNLTGSSTEHLLTLRISNSEGCTDSLTRKITAYPQINTNISADNTAGCHPFTVNFSSNVPAASVQSYIWDFGDGTSSNKKDPTHIFQNYSNNDTIYQVIRTTTTTEGCIDRDTLQINVYPYVSSGFIVDTASGCHPLTVTFSSTSQGGINTYDWDFDGLGSSTDSTTQFTFNNTNSTDVTNNYTVTLTTDNGLGCTSVSTRNIAVYPVPTAGFIEAVGAVDPKRCQPLEIEFENMSDDVASTYYWDFGDSSSFTNTAANKNQPVMHTYDNLSSNDRIYFPSLIATSSHYCSDTVTQSLRVSPFIKAKFTITDGASGCSPDTVSFYNASQGNYISGTWNFWQGNTVSNSTFHLNDTSLVYPRHSDPAPRKHSVVLTARNKDNCISISDTAVVTIYPDVIADYDLDTYEGCDPFIPVFTNNTANATYYDWNLDFENQQSSEFEPAGYEFTNISHTTDINYTIKLRAESIYECWDTISKNITVNYKPRSLVDIDDPSETQNGQPIRCSPYTPVLLNNTVTGPNSVFDWIIYDPTGGIEQQETRNDNSPPAALTVINNSSVPDKYSIFLETTTPDGCKHQDTNFVTVYPRVIANYTVSPDTGCNRLLVDFDATSSINAQFVNIDFGDKETITAKQTNHLYENDGITDKTFTFTIEAESEYQCLDDTTGTITVFPQPVADYKVVPRRQTYPDTTFIFTNQTNDGPFEFDWKWDDYLFFKTNNAEEITRHYTDWTGDTYPITLLATNTEHPQCNDTITQSITLDPPLPIAYFKTDTFQGCVPLTIVFVDTSKYKTRNEWNFDDGSAIISSDSLSHTFDTAGDYLVALTVWGANGVKTDIAYKTITVHPLPEPQIEIIPTSHMVTMPDAYINTRNLTPGGQEHRYSWDFGDGGTSTEFEPVHLYTEENLGQGYTIQLTATTSEGCVDSINTDALVSIMVIGEGEMQFPNAFTPDGDGTNDFFWPVCIQDSNIIVNCSNVLEFDFEIYNRWGELMFKSSKKAGDSDHLGSIKWDGTYRNSSKPAPQGVYVYKIKGRWQNGRQFTYAGDVTLIR